MLVNKTRFLVFSSLMACSLVFAADTAINSGLLPLRGQIGTQAGEYRFEQYNQGELEMFAAKIAKERGDTDRQYFLDAVTKIKNQFEAHIVNTMLAPGGLKELSNRSYTDGKASYVPAIEYVQAVDRYNVSKISLDSTIAALKAYGEQSMPARQEVIVDENNKPTGTVKSIPGYGQIDLSKLTAFYETQVTALETKLKDLPFNVVTKSGTQRAIPGGKGMGLDLKIIAGIFGGASRDDIETWKTEARRLRMWSPLNDKPVINAFATFTKNQLADLLRLYGTTERWRFHSPEYKAEKKKLEGELAELFWARSYLRARYGLQMGAIQTNYTKRVANLDVFFVNSEELAEFRQEIAWTQSDYNQTRQNMRIALDVAKDRSILGRTNMEKDGVIATSLQKANYFFTWVGGKHELADSARIALEMLAADLYEEMLVSQPDSLEKMQAHYRSRYFTDEEMTKNIEALQKRYDPETWAEADAPAADDPLADLDGIKVKPNQAFIASGGVNEHFSAVLLKCQMKEKFDLPAAQDKERSVRIAMMNVQNDRGTEAAKGLRGGFNKPATPPTQLERQ